MLDWRREESVTLDMQNASSTDASALDAFIARKAELDAALCRLQRLSDDFFCLSPDDVNWGHVTELADYCRALKRITDQALREGECAT
jgi:hypothetical protein